MRNPVARARPDLSGYQVVDVLVDRGYQPDVIEVTAGIPIRVTFHRADDDPCSERVVFSSPRVNRRLAATGATSVDLPGQRPGEVRFTCGMGRYRGRIQVIASRRLSMSESLWHRATRWARRQLAHST
jgi:Cu+-exporting ATPase